MKNLTKEHFHTHLYPSPFHSRTEPLNKLNQWGRWKGYLSADAYTDISMEYFASRNTCGVFDLTPMTKHLITGPDALPFLNRLMTREVSKIKPGRVGYCVWCNDDGRVIDDGTLFHLREGVYRLCSQEPQIDWLLTSAIGFDVDIVEDTHDVAALAVQGPTSCAILRKMGLNGLEMLKPFGIEHYPFEGTELMVSRTGYTGDLGYELWIDPSHAEALWDRLFAAGQDYGIAPMGGEALDLVRVEAGFLLAGVDFLPAHEAIRPDRTRSPFEVGLGWLVHLDKPHFTGRRALLEEKRRGSRYNFVKLDIDGNKTAEHSFILDKRENYVGTVTSAMWSPSAKANIALASLEAPHGKVGDEFLAEVYYQRELKWHRVLAPCRVIDGIFFEPARRKMTPAPNF
ncbi:MAG: aminomethyl transferase family protein [Gammaproteobacteria bacterium]|nr:MAG: aminomethyl transferase family protein [Gammaproteobacteria bacterium]